MAEKKISLFDRFKNELGFYQAVLKDPRTPGLTRFLLGAAIAYAVSPIDIIPDFIPLLGQLDDLIIVPLLVFLAVRSIPKELALDIREKMSI